MKNALITGANRGLGLEFARQLKAKGYHVIACCRKLLEADELKKVTNEVIQVDITQDIDIQHLVEKLDGRPIDLLVNNAGISGNKGVTVGNVERENFAYVLNVNCISTLKISDALLPNIQASTEKNILVISSRMSSISDNDTGKSYAYRSSKAALNCVMRSFALDVKPLGVHVMLMHPGWVKTDMGGPDALIDTKTSVTAMLKQAEEHFSNSHAEVLRRYDEGMIPW